MARKLRSAGKYRTDGRLVPAIHFWRCTCTRRRTVRIFGLAPERKETAQQIRVQLRSHVVLPRHFLFDLSAFFVGRLASQNVPSYTRLDTNLTWQGGERISVSVVGQNLLHDHHLETSNTDQIVQSSLIKRSAYAKMTWHF